VLKHRGLVKAFTSSDATPIPEILAWRPAAANLSDCGMAPEVIRLTVGLWRPPPLRELSGGVYRAWASSSSLLAALLAAIAQAASTPAGDTALGRLGRRASGRDDGPGDR